MTRIVVVSRNAAMAMGLAATNHDVIDLRPDAFGSWIVGRDDADGLVLDLDNPQLASAAVHNLRAHGKLGPVLLVSSRQAGWDQPHITELTSVAVLPLPVTRPTLLQALEQLLSARSPADPSPPPEPVLPPEPQPPAAPEVFHTAEALEDLRSSDADEEIDLGGPPLPTPRRRNATLPDRAESTRVLDDLDALRPRAPATVSALEPEVVPGPVAPPVDLVRALDAVIPELFSVQETADVIVADAADRVRADAGVLMVPDDGIWRVSAGVNLRPLEYRYELSSHSWLVTAVANGHRGVIIEESDIAREQLQGAPLASWRHLVAAPVPQVLALLVLARRADPPFDEQDLGALASLGQEAGDLLEAALLTRALARRLASFTDDWHPPPAGLRPYST